MYAAFRLVGASPASGTRIIIRAAKRGAGFAANRAVTPELEGMRRQMMAVHVGLDVERREPGKGLNFQPVIGNADVIEISPGRAMMGISDGNLRLSVGLEDVNDLVGDLWQALKG